MLGTFALVIVQAALEGQLRVMESARVSEWQCVLWK